MKFELMSMVGDEEKRFMDQSRHLFLLFALVRVFPEFSDGIVEVCPDVLPQLLPERAQRFRVVLVHVLPQVLVLPGLIDQVIHFNQDSEEKLGRLAVGLLLGDDRLGLLVGFAQLDEAEVNLIQNLTLSLAIRQN